MKMFAERSKRKQRFSLRTGGEFEPPSTGKSTSLFQFISQARLLLLLFLLSGIDWFPRHLLVLSVWAVWPTFVVEPQAEVRPVPVGVLQVRPVGEIIQFHLFHQERPWHGVGRAHTQTQQHTLSRSRRHTHSQPSADGLASVLMAPLKQKHRAERREDCLGSARGRSRSDGRVEGMFSFF